MWVVQLLVAATPLILWLRVLSYDDHPVLNLVAQQHEKDSKLSSSLPHRCACCAKVLRATLHSVVNVALPAAVHPQAAEAHRTVFPGCPSPQLRSSPRPSCLVSRGPQETARTTRLVLTCSIPRGDCHCSDVYRMHSSTSPSARPGTRCHSSRTYATRPVASWPPQPSLSPCWTNCEQLHQMHRRQNHARQNLKQPATLSKRD